jgi:hypothetical protein
MGRGRKARAASVLAAELDARLAALGIPVGAVPGDEVVRIVAPVAVLVADADARVEKAVMAAVRTRATASALLGKAAGRIAGPPERSFEAFDPAQWQAANGSLS